jgi:hypothetical protein
VASIVIGYSYQERIFMMHDPLKFVRLFVDHCFGAALCLNGKEREGGPAFKSLASVDL